MDIACASVSAWKYQNRHLFRSDSTGLSFTYIFSRYVLQLTLFRRKALTEKVYILSLSSYPEIA